MSGDVHVRFCESAGVRLPRATLPVMVFQHEDDARRVLAVLPKRFGKYGLTLHPEKTRLAPFRRPVRPDRPKTGWPRCPGTFDLLGFTHYWARSRKGNWVVKRKTAKDRFSRALQAIAYWCRRNRHLPVREQWEQLSAKIRGHYAYYGILGNTSSLRRFRYHVMRVWRKWLCRRSDKARVPWEKFGMLEQRYPLPPAVRSPYAAVS
jgi:RNA-directed DNA polymerase